MLLIGQTFFFISKTNNLNGKEIVRTFYEKELQRLIKKNLE